MQTPRKQIQARDSQVTTPSKKYRRSCQASSKHSTSPSCPTLQRITGSSKYRAGSFPGQHAYRFNTSRPSGREHISQPEITGSRSAGYCTTIRSRARPGCCRCVLWLWLIATLSTAFSHSSPNDRAIFSYYASRPPSITTPPSSRNT